MLTNYRPISNLPFIAKIVEKVSSTISSIPVDFLTNFNQAFDLKTVQKRLLLVLFGGAELFCDHWKLWTPSVQPIQDMLPLGQILQNSNVDYHSYAVDTQIYLAMSPDDYSPIESLCHCLEQVHNWMNQNSLQLNHYCFWQ